MNKMGDIASTDFEVKASVITDKSITGLEKRIHQETMDRIHRINFERTVLSA